jgi:hypothetical protein
MNKTIKVIATYEYTNQFVNHNPSLIDLAFGRAFDLAMSQYVYYSDKAIRLKNLHLKALRNFTAIFNNELKKMNLKIDYKEKRNIVNAFLRSLYAFQRTEIFKEKILRPKTRIITIDNEAGIMAQPDFEDFINNTIFEIKTFSLNPIPLYVQKQIRVFQLAFPNYKAIILGFDWKQKYVNIERIEFEEIKENERIELLKELKDFCLKNGKDKEYEEVTENRIEIQYSTKNNQMKEIQHFKKYEYEDFDFEEGEWYEE